MSESNFVTKDSGVREPFDTGAQRDTRKGKGRFDLLPVYVLERDAGLLERGAAKYGDRNWEMGFPFSRCLDSAIRHIAQYIQGDRSEDHLAAARFNIGCVMHFEEMIRQGTLNPALDDLPNYGPVLPSKVPMPNEEPKPADLSEVPCDYKRPGVLCGCPQCVERSRPPSPIVREP